MPKGARWRSSGRRKNPTVVTSLLFVDDLEIWVTRKDVKTMRLKVNGDNARIEVSCPLMFADDEITAFVRQKRDWLDATVAKVQARPAFAAKTADKDEKAAWRAIVEGVVPALVAKWEPIIGVKASKLAYREMKSRWGSCQPATGRICINTRLALYPPDCLEYVVVHELCHLLERGHGPAFKTLMNQFLPTWKDSAAKLR